MKRKYLIRGTCLVLADAAMEVEAKDKKSALRIAKRRFKENAYGRCKYIDADMRTACAWEPGSEDEVTICKEKSN